MRSATAAIGVVCWLAVVGCSSEWKIHGGPQECYQMCRNWNMELTGMVGVGNQDRTGPGATACVCEVPRQTSTGGDNPVGAVGTASSTAAVIVAIQEAERQQQQRQQQQQRPQ